MNISVCLGGRLKVMNKDDQYQNQWRNDSMIYVHEPSKDIYAEKNGMLYKYESIGFQPVMHKPIGNMIRLPATGYPILYSKFFML